MIINILCLQPPHTQRLIIDYLGNEKDVGAVHLAYPTFKALVKPKLQG